MKIRTIIVDDEPSGVLLIKTFLRKYFQHIELCGTAASVQEALVLLEEVKPHLVFLDIQMPGGNGFDLLIKTAAPDFEVIVVSAHDYALKAFKFNAIDYLVKPVDLEAMRLALRKVENRLSSSIRQTEVVQKEITKLVNFHNPFNKISVPGKDGLIFLTISDIVRCEGLLNYTRIHTKSGEVVTCSKTLMSFEKLLGQSNFFRIHKSHLINLSHLKEYVRGDNGYVIMSDNSTLHVSRRSRELFNKRLSFFSSAWSMVN